MSCLIGLAPSLVDTSIFADDSAGISHTKLRVPSGLARGMSCQTEMGVPGALADSRKMRKSVEERSPWVEREARVERGGGGGGGGGEREGRARASKRERAAADFPSRPVLWHSSRFLSLSLSHTLGTAL